MSAMRPGLYAASGRMPLIPPMTLMTKAQKEKQVVEMMVRLYCRKHHNAPRGELCADCAQLVQYAHARIDRCPLGSRKTTCRLCTVHCYAPARREEIRAVMRYAGPRMMLHRPVAAVTHLLTELLARKR